MGLTAQSTGKILSSHKKAPPSFPNAEGLPLLVLAGSPNVGKSTVFNALTGLHQHTGNWTGKTVSTAVGRVRIGNERLLLADVPGTYSLNAHSEEEAVARDFICFGKHDGVIVVCDALCLKRNLAQVLRILEYTPRVTVCVNLIDRAEKKNVRYDLDALSGALGVPVVGCCAKTKKGLNELIKQAIGRAKCEKCRCNDAALHYSEPLEQAIASVAEAVEHTVADASFPSRFAAVRLLCGDTELLERLETHAACRFSEEITVERAVAEQRALLAKNGFSSGEAIADAVGEDVARRAEEICRSVCLSDGKAYSETDKRLDRLFMGRFTAFPILILFLAAILWLTVVGANYPSAFLSAHLPMLEQPLYELLGKIGLPSVLCDMLAFGAYRVTAWVVSVMLPPMAIFFPLFTLLEDMGFLPRVAFNLDGCFRRCRACGKQALTMCMGFGCNAAGVVGCRIIDSPREKLVAVLTNVFVPCNGRFPLFITLLSLFFFADVPGRSLWTALAALGFVFLGVAATFAASYLLTGTVLKGEASAFTLELPPYRMPQVGRVLVRSFSDRTLFVLGRAVLSAAPAGVLIWILGHVTVGGAALLTHFTAFLDPFARCFGMDGVILAAFLLALPANEIVLPVAVMAYMQSSQLTAVGDGALVAVLSSNGWTAETVICVLLFSLMHFPCATTLLTIRKETGSIRRTLFAALLPTVFGLASCFAVHMLWLNK